MILSATGNTALNSTASDDEALVEKPPAAKADLKAWFTLGLVIMIRILMQSQRAFLSFAYGFTGTGIQAGSPIFELSTAYPQLGSLFGTLTGLAYTIPFASFGLIVANWTELYKRKSALMVVCMLAAACMGGTAIVDSFLIFTACRVLHGLVNSSSNPFSYSLTNDTIPAANRATANSLIHSGIYFGNALACLSILLIQ